MSSIQLIPSMIHVLAKLSGSHAGSGGSIYSDPYKLWLVGEGGGGGGGGVAKQLPTISFQHAA